MLNRFVDWLIAYAQRTPYFPLPGYMNRWWIIPFGPLHKGEDEHGCYHARWYRNPLVWLCQQFDIGVRIHEILRSDVGRDFHDHPWTFISIILKGGYTEVTPVYVDGMYVGDKRQWYGPGSVLFRRYHHWHRLELAEQCGPPGAGVGLGVVPCMTFFITFRYRQRWGYLKTPDFKKYYRDVHAAAAAKLPEIR